MRNLLVAPQLRAAEGMRQRKAAAPCSDAFCRFINAANGVDNPNIITDSHRAVRTAIAHKRRHLVRCGSFGKVRLVGIMQQLTQRGFDVVRVHMLAAVNITGGNADGEPVFNDFAAGRNITQGVFMAVL